MKKTVLFVTAIALVIALAGTLVACKTTDVEQGIKQENMQKNEQGNEQETEQGNEPEKEDYNAVKLFEADDVISSWTSDLADLMVFRISEYPYLDDDLKFLADYNVYYPLIYVEDSTPEKVNGELRWFVDMSLQMIQEGSNDFVGAFGFTVNEFVGEQIFGAVYANYCKTNSPIPQSTNQSFASNAN